MRSGWQRGHEKSYGATPNHHPLSSVPPKGARVARARRRDGRESEPRVSAPARKLELGRVGESVRRIDAIPKVTGEFAYASDLFAAGMLFGHTVRSPHAAASVNRIDTKEARGMPGVHAALTHEDVPG